MSDDSDDLTDALIQDTVHCHLCGRPCVLGGHDYIVIAYPRIVVLCIACAANIHAAYEELLRKMAEDAT